jgi:hypothetical protein
MSYTLRPVRSGLQFDVYALEHDGRCDVIDFLIECEKNNAKVFSVFHRHFLRAANEGLIKFNETQVSRVRSNLYEFKVDMLRIYFFMRIGKIIILTNAGKKAGKTDKQTRDIERAEKIRDNYLNSLQK